MVDASRHATTQRAAALVVLLVAGVAGLPVVAAFLDGPSTEDLVVPVHLAALAVVGAVVGILLPGLAGAAPGRARAAGTGAVVGVVAGLLGLAVFYLLLNGA